MSAIERRYAQALMDAIKDKDAKIKASHELDEISELFNSNGQFKKALLDPRISSSVKTGVVKEIFSETNPLFISFISLLIDRNRIKYIDGIAKEYSELTKIMNNELFINIISASSLDDDEINGISDKYKKLYNATTVKYDLTIDESLLGGVKVVVGNKVYDGSLKTQLRNIF
jgi:F-type H+-transporting ATPase subunit delta